MARTAMRVWLASSSRSWIDLPTPDGSLTAHAPGPDPDRVLLVGGNMAVGYGVRSHDLALAGHLARQLSAATGRGTDVDVVAQPNLIVTGCLNELRDSDLSRFDAVVLTFGGTESLQLMSPRRWRRSLEALLEHLAVNGTTNQWVFVLGIVPLEDVSEIPPVARRLGGKRANALNEQTVRVVGRRHRVTFVPFSMPAGAADRPLFEGWANILVPPMVGPLDAGARVPRQPQPVDEAARQRALDELGILDTPPDDEYDTITTMARDLFGVANAAVTFIDRGRQWVKSSAGGTSGQEVPRAEAFCDVTVHRGELYVVEDLAAEEQPRLYVDSTVRFYAGYPLVAPDGQRVGALCIIDTAPRSFDSADAALLRELALRVQALLWAGADAGRSANS